MALILPGLVSAVDKLEILEPENGDVLTTDESGVVEFTVEIENIDPSEENIRSLSLEFTSDEMSFSVSSPEFEVGGASSLDIGDKATFEVEASGLSLGELESKVEIMAKGIDEDDKTARSDDITITIMFPEPELTILAPSSEVTLKEMGANKDTRLSAIIKNSGAANLNGVAVTVETERGGTVCTMATGAQNIIKGRNADYDIDCENISDGDRIRINVEDGVKVAKDFRQVILRVIPEPLEPMLTIIGPHEGEDILVEEDGIVAVTVVNQGPGPAVWVCASLEDDITAETGCKDFIGAGESAELEIQLSDIPGVVRNATITAEDAELLSTDIVNVRIGSAKAWDAEQVWVGNDTPPWADGGDDNLSQGTNGSGDGTSLTGGEDGQGGGIDSTLQYIILIVVVAVLVIYLATGLRKWTGKKTLKERVDERRMREAKLKKRRRTDVDNRFEEVKSIRSIENNDKKGAGREASRKEEPTFEFFDEEK